MKCRKGVPAFQKRSDDIQEAIDAIAVEIVEKYVKPFCDKHGYKFCSGMGTWNFEDSKGEKIDESRLPTWLVELLDWDVDGVLQQGVGSWTGCDYIPPNYTPHQKKRKMKSAQPPFRLICEQVMENQLAHVIYEEYKNKRTEDLLIAEKVARRRGFSEQAIEEFRGGKLPEGSLPSKFYPREME